jgi:sulfoxide reductase catalytic subunit YedY
MTFVHLRHPWDRVRAPVASESLWLGRREILRALGLGGAMLASRSLAACHGSERKSPKSEYTASKRWLPGWEPAGGSALYPAARNPRFTVRRSLNPEDDAAAHNNFYEFLPGRAGPVFRLVGDFEPRPWQVTIAGAVEETRTVDVDEIARIAPLEERLYHFRCVERWSMVVPWTGIPLRAFVEWCKPKASAKYVRFESFAPSDLTPEQREHEPPGFEQAAYYPWPYYEGLRMDEATNELALLVTGIFGHGLPMQHGAPLRVILPWKYGYKSPKSIVRVEFTADEPRTFWHDVSPDEYGFLSNVEPDVPHPRWSQAEEWDITTKDTLPTLPYNGYGELVARMYA